ncbi:MAG: hypothetical protein RDO_1070 [Flavobacteriales endosymbiont of Rhyzopertha dominica]|nr:MAG: ATP-binding protein [Candidatus Shikimatogenerans bostrichidophilus]
MKINFLSKKILKKILLINTINNYYSIIKELIENSIDANSKNIKLYLNKNLNITVIDDGIGMTYNNAIICFYKGTTSKIKNEVDLYNRKYIGYKGNALYCISNISIMEIITKTKNCKIGINIIIKYGKIVKKILCFCKNGSVFKIKNILINNNKILFNKNKKEYNKILNILYKIILCYNKINFYFYYNKKKILIIKNNNFLYRIYNIFFNKIKYYNNLLIYYYKKYKNIKIKIIILNPKYNKYFKKKNYKFIFINKKYINNEEFYNIINLYLLKYINKYKINYFLFIKIINNNIIYNIIDDKIFFNYNNYKNNNFIIKKIKKFIKKFINKIYFINKKKINFYFNIKKKLFYKKKKKNINKNIKYIKNYFFNLKYINKIDFIYKNKKYILLIYNNKKFILNFKKINNIITYNYLKYYNYNKIFYFKQLLILPLIIKIPYYINYKNYKIIKLLIIKKINNFIKIKIKNKLLFIYYIPINLNKKDIIKIFNKFFLLLKNKKKINIINIILKYYINNNIINKNIYFKINIYNIKNYLFKILNNKKYYLFINIKKI